MDSASADEELELEARRRRSTDCIYFLASPLTCKKGNDCEYRHSETARMNPRDCWYWFNGNCANPKCSFRHPPLDNLHGAPATPRAAQQSAPQVSVPAQQTLGSIPASGTTKQGVPCYYFQKGMCVKGDKCAFLHVPHAAGNNIPQQISKAFAPALQPHPLPKNSWTKPNSSDQHNTPPAIPDKLKVEAHIGKPAQKQNLTSRLDRSSGISQNDNNPYVLSVAAKNYQPEPSVEDELADNGTEVGEFVREPSAGSGVLIGVAEDDAEQSFRGNHNSYRRINGETHTGMLRQKHASYESERLHTTSAERLMSGRGISDRGLPPVTADNSYLQHMMLKQRRLNNPRSTELSDRHDIYPEEECRGHQRWPGEEPAIHDGLSRSRLHGRIKLPGETILDRLGPHPEKERGRGPRARLSPPKQTDLRGMLHGRLKARSNEDVSRNVKSSVAKANSGEDVGSLSFAGPKSLAELKAKKVAGGSGEHGGIRSGGSFAGPARMTSEIVAVRESSSPVPFDGPKPLSVILKRKREAASENATDSSSTQEEHTVGEKDEPQDKLRKLDNEKVGMSTEGNGEEAFHPEDDVAFDDNLSPPDDNDVEATGDAGKELEELQDLEVAEEYDDDEAADVDGEEDYQEHEDDDLDDDDDDDFARRVGVMI